MSKYSKELVKAAFLVRNAKSAKRVAKFYTGMVKGKVKLPTHGYSVQAADKIPVLSSASIPRNKLNRSLKWVNKKTKGALEGKIPGVEQLTKVKFRKKTKGTILIGGTHKAKKVIPSMSKTDKKIFRGNVYRHEVNEAKMLPKAKNIKKTKIMKDWKGHADPEVVLRESNRMFAEGKGKVKKTMKILRKSTNEHDYFKRVGINYGEEFVEPTSRRGKKALGKLREGTLRGKGKGKSHNPNITETSQNKELVNNIMMERQQSKKRIKNKIKGYFDPITNKFKKKPKKVDNLSKQREKLQKLEKNVARLRKAREKRGM